MLDGLNDALKQLLKEKLRDDVDVAFERPTREWSAKVNRPTVNFFLLKVLENRKLRDLTWESQRHDARTRRKWAPKRVDAYYMVTAWATEPRDEYHLLWHTLAVLIRHQALDEETFEDSKFYDAKLPGQERPIALEVAQTEILENPAEIWSALNNEFKPSISLRVTLELDLEIIEERPLVFTKELVFRDLTGGIEEHFFQVGGTVFDGDGAPLAGATVRVVERDQAADTDDQGRFTFTNVPVGSYTLEATAPDGSKRRRQVDYSKLGQDYDFTL